MFLKRHRELSSLQCSGESAFLSLHSTEPQPGAWLAPTLQAGPSGPVQGFLPQALPTASASRSCDRVQTATESRRLSPWRDGRRGRSPFAFLLLRTLIPLPGGGREKAQNPPCSLLGEEPAATRASDCGPRQAVRHTPTPAARMCKNHYSIVKSLASN